MNIEASFLAPIRAAPSDVALRLVYADWLEERNDPRGELVRVEEEMSQLAVFSDQYWRLKPRRNELRTQARPDWLEAMHYGTDCQPIFRHGVPDGWKERWRLVREFIDQWHRLPLPDVGGRTDQICEIEVRLGRTLPPSVREWVAFAHDVRRSANYHDVLRDVYQMQELDGFSAISLLLECEGGYIWAVRHGDLAIPDPPVYGFHWDFENEDESTFVPDQANPIAPTVSAFAFGYVLATDGKGGGFGTDIAEARSLIRNLETTFTVRCRFGQKEIFEGENILVQLQPTDRPSGTRISVKVAKPLPREAIPPFLWDCTHNGGWFQGMFDPGRRHE
jgi:uncharacterized protein (TIGR02996 family)